MPRYHDGWIIHDAQNPIDIREGDRILFAINFENSDDAIESCTHWWTFEEFIEVAPRR